MASSDADPVEIQSGYYYAGKSTMWQQRALLVAVAAFSFPGGDAFSYNAQAMAGRAVVGSSTYHVVKAQQNMVSLVEQQQHPHAHPHQHHHQHQNGPLLTIPRHSRGNTVLIDNYSDLTPPSEVEMDTEYSFRSLPLRQIDLAQLEIEKQKIRLEQELSNRQEELRLNKEQIWVEGMALLEQERQEQKQNLLFATTTTQHRHPEIVREHERLSLEWEEQRNELATVQSKLKWIKKEMLNMQRDMVCLMTQVQNANDELTTTREEHDMERLEMQQQVHEQKQQAEAEFQAMIKQGLDQQIRMTQHYKQELQDCDHVLRHELERLREAKFDYRNLDRQIAMLEENRTRLSHVGLLMMQLLVNRLWVVVSTLVLFLLSQLHKHTLQSPQFQRKINTLRHQVAEKLPRPTRSTMQSLVHSIWNVACLACQQAAILVQRIWHNPKVQQSRRRLLQQLQVVAAPNGFLQNWKSNLHCLAPRVWDSTTTRVRQWRSSKR